MKILDKIHTTESIDALLKEWNGQQVVFTNGCFDILHAGHVDYLEKAKQLGGKLIVGMNTDNSVRRLKGITRPICDQYSRSVIVAALEVVDAVILFEEDTPYELISALKPDILVKGNDYKEENIIGAEIVKQKGGVVTTIPLLEGYSTTAIVNKIKNQK